MADFLTRLAERTLGIVPVVQPLIAPEFASDPIPNVPDPGWTTEASSSDDPTDAPPTDAATGRSELTVVEPPGIPGDVASVAPEPGEQEAEVASPPGARRSSPPKPRPVEDIPDRISTHPAEGEGAVDPRTIPPSVARRLETRAPGAPADLSPRSVVDASRGERVTPESVSRAARVETTEEMLETEDNAREGPEEVTKALPQSQEHPPPTTPSHAGRTTSRATRATQITTVVPAKPARRPDQPEEPAHTSTRAEVMLETEDNAKEGPEEVTKALPQSQEHPPPTTSSHAGRATSRATRATQITTVVPAKPARRPDQPEEPAHAATRAEEPERPPSLPPGTTQDERESGPRVEASPPAPATPNRILVRPVTGPSDIHQDADTHQPPQSTPSEPIIRVNIGRVEVRAAEPPLQQTAKPARLSLDDYLRSRSKGRR
jgi:hypothetical protein